MAISYEETTSNGSQVLYTIPCPFLTRSHVYVKYNGVEQPTSSYTFNSDTQITLDAAASNGVTVRVGRTTPQTVLTNFPSSMLQESDLDDGYLQQLYIAQELQDTFDEAIAGTLAVTLAPLNNLVGTTAPGVGDDTGDGYSIGSMWVDVTNDKAYVLVDSTLGAAVWVETTAGAAGGITDVIDDTTPQLGGTLDINAQSVQFPTTTITDVLDEDAMGSDSPTMLATQQSIKAYVDAQAGYTHPNHSGDVTSVADGAQTIAANAVTLAKMATMATASLLGRNTAGTGDPEVLSKATALSLLNVEDGAEVTSTAKVTSAGALMDSEVDADIKTLVLPANTTISTFGATVVDDANAAAARTTLDVDQAGTDNSTDVTLAGTPDYITLSGQVLTRNAVDLAADVTGVLPTANIADEAVTLAKIAHMATASLLGRNTAATGDVEVLSKATALSLLNVEDGADVTDTTNVTDAGALMDSECADVAAVKATTGTFLVADESKLDGIEASADVTDETNVTAALPVSDATTLVKDPADATKLVRIDAGNITTGNTRVITMADENIDLGANQTKLDGIETSADVTDTTNVTNAGALMDSEVDADIKTLVLPANTTISAFGATLVDDAAASNARTTLGVDAAGTDNSTDVTLAGTPDYITLAGQVLTRNQIDLTADVTGELPYANMAGIPVVQQVYTSYKAASTGTTLITPDDNIPQKTHGDQYMSQAITPTNTSNILVIEGQMWLASDAVAYMTVALFQDTTADALFATSAFQNTNLSVTMPFIHIMAAGTTSETTFKVRAGGHQTNTVTLNGYGGVRKLGDIPKSWIRITEYTV